MVGSGTGPKCSEKVASVSVGPLLPLRASMLPFCSLESRNPGTEVVSGFPVWLALGCFPGFITAALGAEKAGLDALGSQQSHRVLEDLVIHGWGFSAFASPWLVFFFF